MRGGGEEGLLRARPLRGTSRGRSTSLRAALLRIWIPLGSLAFLALFVLVSFRFYTALRSTEEGPTATLVVYIFRDVDPESVNNLRYFLRAGVSAEDSATRFIVALDAALSEKAMIELPPLPPNAQWVKPPQQCWTLGTLGWVLFESGAVDVGQYKYFVWVNHEVRGPFLPAWAAGKFRWHTLLTERLTPVVKLVGSFISCEILFVVPDEDPLINPHVLEQVGATDHVGLEMMRKERALACEPDWLKAQVEGHYMASAVIVDGGFNLDCLMLRYQGVDWRDQDSSWGCNAAVSPLYTHLYDGISLTPFEVLFVPYSHAQVVTDAPAAAQASAYSQWTLPPSAHPNWKAPPDVLTNRWLGIGTRHFAEIRDKPESCFDADLYIQSSPIEFGGLNRSAAYAHFMASGFFQGRPYQFVC